MKGRFTFGLFIIAIGILILLKNMQIIETSIGSLIADFWPALLVIWGLGFIFERTGACGKIVGTITITLGILLLGRNLGWLAVDFALFWKLLWPLVLILAGVGILTRSAFGGRSHVALMGSIAKKDVWKLKNDTYWALMGSIELDLRQAEILEGTTTLNATAAMGGIDIIVPPELTVICEGTSILGGIEFFNKNNGGILASLQAEQGEPKNSSKIVRIHCFAMMGGIEVRTIS